ncbi:MAG: general secretion pathway protein GspK [Planctomycetes bacterium]|nr:general secretion pathway protein GspK [Planctomycetota bacterium]
MILLVVLAIIAVLALIAASFAYRMEGERLGIEALGDLQQARLAGESAMERVKHLLRDDRTNMDLWYDNPEAFRRVPVWMPDSEGGLGGDESPTRKEVVPGQPAWRYSVVAYEVVAEDKVVIRYGLTDEAGKLNINFASRGELLRLVKSADLKELPAEALVDALIDWRDRDDDFNSPAGAESPWYMSRLGYRAKNRPFDSVEELLMVRYWDGRFLFGEDANRNGYLDENEDDGDEGAFPDDNGDNKLDRGLARLLTTYSWDWDFANDNKPRSNINQLSWNDREKLPKQLQDELSEETIGFLAEAKKRGFKFRSVGELWGLQVFEDGSSNYDEAWEAYKQQVTEENEIPKPAGEDQGGEDQGGQDQGDQDQNNQGDDRVDGQDRQNDQDQDNTGGDRTNPSNGSDRRNTGETDDDSNRDDDEEQPSAREKNDQRRRQSVRDENNTGSVRDGRGNRGDNGRRDSQAGRGRQGTGDGRQSGTTGSSGRSSQAGRTDQGSQPGEDDEARKGEPVISPVTPEQMNVVLDRLTVRSPQQIQVPGRINVNTAPFEVLRSIIGITDEEAKRIVEARKSLAGPDKMTTAWLVTSGALAPEKYAVIANKITARSIQFTADVIGFADHVGTFRRLQAVIEMRGHMAQIRYYRDISSLGIGFPVKDDERTEGLSYQPQ